MPRFAPLYDWTAAAAWYRDGASLAEIRRRLGCTYRAVTKARRRLRWMRASAQEVAHA